MNIKTIGYGELRTDGGYNNKKIYLEAEISDTDDETKCFNKLKQTISKLFLYDNEDDLPPF